MATNLRKEEWYPKFCFGCEYGFSYTYNNQMHYCLPKELSLRQLEEEKMCLVMNRKTITNDQQLFDYCISLCDDAIRLRLDGIAARPPMYFWQRVVNK